MNKKITAIEFINQRFPQFKSIPSNDLNKVIDGNTWLVLMEEYYMYRNILEKTSENPDNYDYYH